jgi:hypothetical protein
VSRKMEDGIGRSEATADKADGFRKWIGMHVAICRNMISKCEKQWPGWPDPCYHYIDAYAGSGTNYELGPGSPVIFATEAAASGVRWKAYLIDEVQRNVEMLKSLVGRSVPEDQQSNASYWAERNEEAICAVVARFRKPKASYGMLYSDPNGLANHGLARLVSVELPRIDILARLSATSYKRAGRRISEFMTDVPKDKWSVRAPVPGDKHQWTFLFGTNFEPGLEWRNEGFHLVGSGEGKAILKRLDTTAREAHEMVQPSLFARSEAMTRSNGICEECRTRPATEINHLKYGPPFSAENLRHVCHECHCEYHRKAS